MTKAIGDYTPEELQEIGRKTVLARQRQTERDKEKNDFVKQAWELYKAGKLKLPKE